MLTGRITYGLGQALDEYGQPVVTASSIPAALAQSSVFQSAPAQWGAGEWAVVLGGFFVLYSVFSTSKRHVGQVRGTLQRRRQRLAEQHEAAAKHYRASR